MRIFEYERLSKRMRGERRYYGSPNSSWLAATGLMAGTAFGFALQCAQDRSRAFTRCLVVRILGGLGILLRLLSHRSGSFRRCQLHSGATRLGKANRDRLLRRTRAVLTLSDVMDLFANEFSGLSGRGLALAGVFSGSLDGFALRHDFRPPLNALKMIVLDEVLVSVSERDKPGTIRHSL
jgi:hypothetical protein